MLGRQTIGVVAASCALLAAGTAHAAPADRAAGLALLQAQLADEKVASGWTGSTAGCNAGTESAASLDATLRSVNRIRGMAGVAPVTFDPDLNRRALAAALMMEAETQLSHFPDADWACYSADGADGARNSNLFLAPGLTGAAAITTYLTDDHRDWMLDRAARVMGSGTTTQANALYAITDRGRAAVSAASATAWPPPGWVAWEWIPDSWSVSVGNDTSPVSFSDAQIKMTMDGKPLAIPAGGTIGDGAGAGATFYWRPVLPSRAGTDDRVFRVEITGVTSAGQPVPLSWTVCALHSDVQPTAANACAAADDRVGGASGGGGGGGGGGTTSATPRFTRSPGLRRLDRRGRKQTFSGRVSVGTRLAVSVATAGGRRSYQWLRSGRRIAGATGATYRVRRADRGRKLQARVTVTSGVRVVRRTTRAVGVR